MGNCKSRYPLFLARKAQSATYGLGKAGMAASSVPSATRGIAPANRREVAAYAELTRSLLSSANHPRGPITGSQVTPWREGQQAPRSQRRTQVSIVGLGIADIAA
jgi:hypothetical protein